MGKPSAPPPPDYAALAKQQAVDNKDSAQYNTTLNRANQITADGSLTWAQGTPNADGTPGTWTQTQTLSPDQERLRKAQMDISQNLAGVAGGALQRVGDSMSKSLDPSTLRPREYSSGGQLDMETMLSPLVAPGQRASASLGQAGQGTAAQAQAAGGISSTIDRSGVRGLPGSVDDTSRRRVEDALLSRINPSMQIDEDRLRNRLLNSGIEVGTDAYNRELTLSGQRTTDARMQAILAGGQEESRQVGLTQGLQRQEFEQAQAQAAMKQAADSQMSAQQNQVNLGNAAAATATSNSNAGLATQTSLTNASNESRASEQAAVLEAQRRQGLIDTAMRTSSQNFNQGLASSSFNNETRAKSLEEFFALQQQPLNQLNALRTGSQVTAPNFGSYYTGGNAAPAPSMDAGIARGNYDMQAYQQQMAGNNALWGGLASLGGAALKSDIRLKKNIRRVGNHPSGVSRYTWDWKDGSGSSVGVLAQELQTVRPDAVIMQPSGYLSVRYDLIGGF